MVRSLARSGGPEDLRLFQLHLIDQGVSPITINATQTGLRFFFEITLDRPEVTGKMRPVRVAQRLPVVLTREEATRLIDATRNLKHRAALSVAYGAGLRASEVVSLKVSDVDSKRMVLRVDQGKGRKDRYALLPPVLLTRLRGWWRYARAEGKVLPDGWLFPGQDPMEPMSTRQLNRAVHEAATAAHIDKRVSMHSLRHAVNRRRELTSVRRRMLTMGGCDNLQILIEKCRFGAGPPSAPVEPKPWSNFDAGSHPPLDPAERASQIRSGVETGN